MARSEWRMGLRATLFAAVCLIMAEVTNSRAQTSDSLVVLDAGRERPLRIDQSPCDDATPIRTQVDAFQDAFAPAVEDLDADGLPEDASAALIVEAVCRDATMSLAAATLDAYNANLAILDSEPEPGVALNLREGVAALMLIGVSAQDAVLGALADGGIALQGEYLVVTCADPSNCVAEAAGARAVAESFSGPGDLDGDGVTNAVEFQNVADRGGDLSVFVSVAFDDEDDGTDGTIKVDDDGLTCVFTSLLRGTPFAGRLDALRGWRDHRLLTRPAGALVADVYYRLSPRLAGALAARPRLLHWLRARVGDVHRMTEELGR